MKNIRMRLVIKDEKGNYVWGFMGDFDGVIYCSFDGRTTGFTTYGNVNVAHNDLAKFQSISDKHGMNKTFTLSEVDINSIPMGKRIIEEIKIEFKVA